MSISSASSHTTLTRTCCLLSSLLLSAEQWQLSTVRSGQFLLLRLGSHRPSTTHSQPSALMLRRARSRYVYFHSGVRGVSPSMQCPSPVPTCCVRASAERLALLWRRKPRVVVIFRPCACSGLFRVARATRTGNFKNSAKTLRRLFPGAA